MSTTSKAHVNHLVDLELWRQQTLKKAGKFPFVAQDPELSNQDCLVILTEEFGEVARAVCDGDRTNLEEELVQVIAVCTSWLMGLPGKTVKKLGT